MLNCKNIENNMTQNNMTPKNVGYAYLNNFFMNHWFCKIRANSLFLGGIAGETLKWRLHPLIHTLLGFAQAQDVEKKKSEVKNSAFS